jgi:hypothetical protein
MNKLTFNKHRYVIKILKNKITLHHFAIFKFYFQIIVSFATKNYFLTYSTNNYQCVEIIILKIKK